MTRPDSSSKVTPRPFWAKTWQLLKQVQARDAVHRLCSLAGESGQILGKTLFDLHEYALAWAYYTFSLKAAQAAFNHQLWAVGLGRMSLLLIVDHAGDL